MTLSQAEESGENPDIPGLSPSNEPAFPPESIQFESLEELSKKEIPPTAEPTSEKAISGMDMSAVDTPVEDAPFPDFGAPAEFIEAPAGDTAESAVASLEVSQSTQATRTTEYTRATQSTPQPSIDSIKSYSENLVTSDAQVVAAFPFTLKIEGKLTPEESEKLVSILEREKMGISAVDLESQIEEGQILIPRISEYAGILLIQALRGVSAKILFGPSDEIYSTPDTREDLVGSAPQWTVQDTIAEIGAALESADEVVVTNTEKLPQFSKLEVLDMVVVSGLLSTAAVEAKASQQYTHLLEALMRELKFKAKRRGANGIISLTITLAPLTLPTDYRVTVSGTAVVGS